MNRTSCSAKTDHNRQRISCQKLFILTIKWISAGLREREAGCCPFVSGNERTPLPSAEAFRLAGQTARSLLQRQRKERRVPSESGDTALQGVLAGRLAVSLWHYTWQELVGRSHLQRIHCLASAGISFIFCVRIRPKFSTYVP